MSDDGSNCSSCYPPPQKRDHNRIQNHIQEIAHTYHLWRDESAEYQDIPGFCASVPVSRVAELDYVLTPGRYVGLPEEEDDFNFAERFTALKAEFEEQLKEEERLNKVILENLGKIKIE
ncbi:MAG: N-6 DNA methylase [Oscillospiraceae bacterium]|nr:N-6 DNA methylase [Oscillospiraceae bacterium]